MTTSRTQIGFLDLAAFYQQAKSAKVAKDNLCLDVRWLAGDLADKLLCVIDAIRDDGLDPRWNPERDALRGIAVSGGEQEGYVMYRRHVVLSDKDAEDLLYRLHQRGYKIVKDDAA